MRPMTVIELVDALLHLPLEAPVYVGGDELGVVGVDREEAGGFGVLIESEDPSPDDPSSASMDRKTLEQISELVEEFRHEHLAPYAAAPPPPIPAIVAIKAMIEKIADLCDDIPF